MQYTYEMQIPAGAVSPLSQGAEDLGKDTVTADSLSAAAALVAIELHETLEMSAEAFEEDAHPESDGKVDRLEAIVYPGIARSDQPAITVFAFVTGETEFDADDPILRGEALREYNRAVSTMPETTLL